MSDTNTERFTSIQFAGDDFFISTTPSGHALTVDVNGDRKKAPGPLELFLTGVGWCTAADVISILQKKREQVTDYRVEVRTQRREDHPRAFVRIEIKHLIRGHQISEAAVSRAVSLSTDKYCSAVATVRPTAEVVSSYEIREA